MPIASGASAQAHQPRVRDGCTAIDTLLTIGEGQRVGVVAPVGVARRR